MMLKLSSDVSSCAKPARPSSSTTPKIPRARLMPPILSSRAFLVTHNENPSERPAVPRSGCPRSRGVPRSRRLCETWDSTTHVIPGCPGSRRLCETWDSTTPCYSERLLVRASDGSKPSTSTQYWNRGSPRIPSNSERTVMYGIELECSAYHFSIHFTAWSTSPSIAYDPAIDNAEQYFPCARF